jgi:hypothetical protein
MMTLMVGKNCANKQQTHVSHFCNDRPRLTFCFGTTQSRAWHRTCSMQWFNVHTSHHVDGTLAYPVLVLTKNLLDPPSPLADEFDSISEQVVANTYLTSPYRVEPWKVSSSEEA